MRQGQTGYCPYRMTSHVRAMLDDNEHEEGSAMWLAHLLGQAWAPQPQDLLSDGIRSLARRGARDGSDLTKLEVEELSASVVAYRIRSATPGPR